MVSLDAHSSPACLDTAQSLAKFLNVSVACVRKYTCKPGFPSIHIGHAVRFDRIAVLDWLSARQLEKQPQAVRRNGADDAHMQ